jgi:hypothetical protein
MLMMGALGYAQEARATIQDLQGTVELKAPGSDVWQPAVSGQELEQETLVSTGFRSSALIVLGNSTILVRPLTRLSLREIQVRAGRIEIELRAGRVRAEVKPVDDKGMTFTVRSPVTTSSVRGTVFDIDTLNLRVEEGTVAFSGLDNTVVYVQAGQSSSPDQVTGKVAVPVEITASRTPPPPAGVESVAPAAPTVISVPPSAIFSLEW